MSTKKLFLDLDLTQHELQNAKIQNVDPTTITTPVTGQIVIDTTDSYKLKYYNGSTWVSTNITSISTLTIGTGLSGTSYNGTSPVTISIDNTVLVNTGSYNNPTWLIGVPYSILTGTIPTWNQNTTGTASNITATTNNTLTTLSALSLPYTQLTGTVPTWNQNTTGNAATATITSNITGRVANDLVYQSGVNTTSFINNSSGVLYSNGTTTPHWSVSPTLTSLTILGGGTILNSSGVSVSGTSRFIGQLDKSLTLTAGTGFSFSSTVFDNSIDKTLTLSVSNIPNASLANSSITINGTSVSLGGSTTVTAALTNSLTISTGLQLNTGSTFDGSVAKTLSITSDVTTYSKAASGSAAHIFTGVWDITNNAVPHILIQPSTNVSLPYNAANNTDITKSAFVINAANTFPTNATDRLFHVLINGSTKFYVAGNGDIKNSGALLSVGNLSTNANIKLAYNGYIQFGDGSGTTYGKITAPSDNQIAFTSNSANRTIKIEWGDGNPISSPGAGSIYCRTGGSGTGNLYVFNGSTWTLVV